MGNREGPGNEAAGKEGTRKQEATEATHLVTRPTYYSHSTLSEQHSPAAGCGDRSCIYPGHYAASINHYVIAAMAYLGHDTQPADHRSAASAASAANDD